MLRIFVFASLAAAATGLKSIVDDPPLAGRSFSVVLQFNPMTHGDIQSMAATLRINLDVKEMDMFILLSSCSTASLVKAAKSCRKMDVPDDFTPIDAETKKNLKAANWHIDAAYPDKSCRKTFDFIPREKFTQVCEDAVICRQPPCVGREILSHKLKFEVKSLARLGVVDFIPSSHVLFLDMDFIVMGPLSLQTLTTPEGKSRRIQPKCGVEDPSWLEWEHLLPYYSNALSLLSNLTSTTYRPIPGSCVVNNVPPALVTTTVVRRLRRQLERRQREVAWYSLLINIDFNDLTLINTFILLNWKEFGDKLSEGEDSRVITIWNARNEVGMNHVDKYKRQDIALQHARWVIEKTSADGELRDALFLNCRIGRSGLTSAECVELAKFAGGLREPYSKDIAKKRYAAIRSKMPKACPGKLGIAINTGDQYSAMSRVRFSLGDQGWVGNPKARNSLDWDRENLPVVVYSNLAEGCIPLGEHTLDDKPYPHMPCVPVKQCCDGNDLGSTLADAQRMRENTWSKMLRDLPDDTEWFISTEEDVWWDIEVVCNVLGDIIQDLGTFDERTAILAGGGAPVDTLVYCGLIVMNRPLLEIYANETYLDECREDLLQNTAWRERFKAYPGAAYNNDHFFSYCLHEFFPKRLPEMNIIARVDFPFFMDYMPRPSNFYHNGEFWSESKRGWDFVKLLEDHEAIAAFHHATIADMAYLQDTRST